MQSKYIKNKCIDKFRKNDLKNQKDLNKYKGNIENFFSHQKNDNISERLDLIS